MLWGKRHPPSPAPTPPLTILFVRHAESREIDADAAQDPDLTRRGCRQAEGVARRLARERFDHIYVSDLQRAYRTGLAISRHHASTPLTVTRALREVSALHCAPAGGLPAAERAALDTERVTMDEFARFLRQTHRQGERLLLVSHGNFIRAFVALLAGRDPHACLMFDVNNTSVSILETWPGGKAVLRLVNCSGHLPERHRT